MKVLIVNKFLYPNGGSETYIFKIGNWLISQGHEVEYFGMEHEGRIVGNRVNSYTSDINFHTGKLNKLLYPFKIIYSIEARKKIRRVLADFMPEVVHLNNFNFQLTPSMIYEIKKFEKQRKHKIRIIFTAHDYQLVCPNHTMNNPLNHQNCFHCAKGRFLHCLMGRCIHGSRIKSLIGTVEGYFYHMLKTYQYIDRIICPSKFLADRMNTNTLFKDKTIVLHNFIDEVQWKEEQKEDYILYFGRYSEEKGINTLIEVCKSLPDIQFIFAGSGPLEDKMKPVQNIKNAGFQTGEELERLIRKARFSIYPSEWYENCPFSVMESQMYGTPVLGADIGGIPELIEAGRTGELFKSGNTEELKEKIRQMLRDHKKAEDYKEGCKKLKFNTISEYCTQLISIYQGQNQEKEGNELWLEEHCMER